MRNVEALFNEFRNSNSHPALKIQNVPLPFANLLIRRTKERAVQPMRIIYIIYTRASKKELSSRPVAARLSLLIPTVRRY